MLVRRSVTFGLLVCLAGALPGQAVVRAAAQPPILRLEPGGPTARVNTLAFGPDGHILYGAGFDKVIRAWTWDDRRGRFVLAGTTYRVPVGAATVGTINCLAASADGRWLAASGLGLTHVEADFRSGGQIIDISKTFTDREYRERSLIYLFRVGTDEVHVLRGHTGPVLALAFVPSRPRQPGHALLVSAGWDRWLFGGQPGGDVRVWDVDRAGTEAAQLAQVTVPAVRTNQRFGLAVRPTGNGPKDLHVALAWADGQLRVWDVAGNRVRSAADGAPNGNLAAAYLPSADGKPPELLTTGWGIRGGRLQRWTDPADAGPEPQGADWSLEPLTPGEAGPLACALDLASSGSGRGLDRAVLVVRQALGGDRQQYALRLTDLSGGPANDVTVPLWTSPRTRDPALTCSPDGRFVAVADAERPEVLVYPVAALRRGGPPVGPWHLRGLGPALRSVAFVRKGADPLPGLLVRAALPGWSGDRNLRPEQSLIFDFARRKLFGAATAEGRDWKAVGSDWTVREVRQNRPGPRRVFEWSGGGETRSVAVVLPPREEVTAVAVVPPVAGSSKVPVLVVAAYSEQRSEPRLALFDARSGVRFRSLLGHAGPIRSLAVSPDGRLLASAAEDETVCLWTMTDLSEILGKHGALSGVDFGQGKDGVVVSAVPDGKTAAELQKGDRVTGLTFPDDRAPRPVASVLDLDREVFRHANPGTAVVLQVERPGEARPRPVRLVAGQGIDGRTPLFSLFLTTAADGGPGWVAWTPSGYFDASGPDVEKFVGWQFNPARFGEEHIRFAPLDEYRKQFHDSLLLKQLVVSANLPRALERIAFYRGIPKLDVGLSLSGSEKALTGGEVLVVHEPRPELQLTVRGPSIEKGQIGSILIDIDGQTEAPDLAGITGSTLSIPVPLRERQERTVRVTVRTREDLQVVRRAVTLRFQPLPPEITFANLPAGRLVVHDRSFRLRARVRPGTAGQEVRIARVELNRNPIAARGPDLDTTLTLQEGENDLVIEAVNADAPAGAASETTRERRVLVYQEVKAPEITAIRVVEEGADVLQPARRVQAGSAEVVVVAAPRVRLQGQVTARQPLAPVRLHIGAKARVARGTYSGDRTSFTLDHPLDLKPGEETVLNVEAATALSKPARASVRLVYHPLLPEIDVAAPKADEVLYDRRHQGAREVELTAVLKRAAHFSPFTVVYAVSHGDQAGVGGNKEFKQPVPADTPTVSLGRLRLLPGSNRIAIHVENPWRKGEVLERYVTLRQPPLLLAVTVPDKVTRPFVAVRAQVECPAGLPLTRVLVNDTEYPAKDVVVGTAPGPRAGLTISTVAVKAVALAGKGKNPVRVRAVNADGDDEQSREVVVEQPPPPKAEVYVLNLPDNNTVAAAHFDLDLRVDSLSPLTALRLLQGTQPPRDLPLNLVRKLPQGYFEWRASLPIDLAVRDNSLTIEAENAGGVARLPVTLTYVPAPGKLLLRRPGPTVAQARVRLYGSIHWTDPDQARQIVRQIRQVKVYVNDSLQGEPRLEPSAADRQEQRFSVELILNRKSNEVQVECPFPLEDETQKSFRIDCPAPEGPHTLRVLLVNAGAAGVRDEDLLRRVFAALRVKSGKGARLHSQDFDSVVLYPKRPDGRPAPLSFSVEQSKVEQQLEVIGREIKRDAAGRQGAPSDVVLIYWLGKDLVREGSGDWFLPTSDPTSPGLPLERLLHADGQVPGARVLLLDVAAARGKTASDPDWSRGHSAVLRYVWSRANVPVPGLAAALEEAGRGKARISLADWAGTAEALAGPLGKEYRTAVRLTNLLPPSLGSLVVAGPEKP